MWRVWHVVSVVCVCAVCMCVRYVCHVCAMCVWYVVCMVRGVYVTGVCAVSVVCDVCAVYVCGVWYVVYGGAVVCRVCCECGVWCVCGVWCMCACLMCIAVVSITPLALLLQFGDIFRDVKQIPQSIHASNQKQPLCAVCAPWPGLLLATLAVGNCWSCGCHNKLSQAECLKTEMYPLTVLEARVWSRGS